MSRRFAATCLYYFSDVAQLLESSLAFRYFGAIVRHCHTYSLYVSLATLGPALTFQTSCGLIGASWSLISHTLLNFWWPFRISPTYQIGSLLIGASWSPLSRTSSSSSMLASGPTPTHQVSLGLTGASWSPFVAISIHRSSSCSLRMGSLAARILKKIPKLNFLGCVMFCACYVTGSFRSRGVVSSPC